MRIMTATGMISACVVRSTHDRKWVDFVGRFSTLGSLSKSMLLFANEIRLIRAGNGPETRCSDDSNH